MKESKRGWGCPGELIRVLCSVTAGAVVNVTASPVRQQDEVAVGNTRAEARRRRVLEPLGMTVSKKSLPPVELETGPCEKRMKCARPAPPSMIWL